jgi:isocitrate/isopropylmalate dehydrogenase
MAWEMKKLQKLKSYAEVINEGIVRTYDMGGSDKTLDLAKAIAEKL